ncbi:MAG: hypothetical protein ACKOBX_01350 [Bacteroidota bacterium]
MMRPFIYFSFLTILSFSTKAQFSIDSVDYQYGGGVTGQSKTFRFSAGKIIMAEGLIEPPFHYYRKLKKSNWKKICKNAELLMDDPSSYQKPSNYYISISIYSGIQKKKYTWALDDGQVPAEVHDFATLLKNISLK